MKELHAQVEQPSKNFHTCRDIDLDCEDALRPREDFEYCRRAPPGFGPCRYYDTHSVQPMKYEDAVFVATTSRRAAAGRAELLAEGQHTDRLQNPAKLRRFGIGGRIGGRITRNFKGGISRNAAFSSKGKTANFDSSFKLSVP